MSAKPWLATYRRHGIPESINADAYPSINHLLDQAIQTYADQPAFKSFGQTLTYRDVDRQADALAAWFQKRLGLKKGDRVAVMMPNLLAFPITFIALARLGAVQVNVNPLYTPRELEHQLKDSGSETIVIFSGSTPTLAEIIGKTPVRQVITVDLGDGAGAALPSPQVDGRLQGTHRLADALKEGATLKVERYTARGDDLLFLQYTGGTTGFSKGASLTHRNLVANTEQFKAFQASAMLPGEEVMITAIPLYHIMALMVNFLTYFSIGTENWLVANPRDMDGLVKTFADARPTVFIGVNTLYSGLVQHPKLKEVDFSRLRLSGGGGAAVLQATSEQWRAITGQFIREGYGLSETSPVLSFNPAMINRFTGHTGLPVPDTEIKLLRDDDSEAPIGESGEICVRGPQVMSGYWNRADANQESFTADGYFRTGDVGQFDEEGNLKIVDRKKDMILVSGFNVYPNEVEAVAASCPGVLESGCVGVPDAKTGEAVKLYVVRTAGSNLTEEELIAHCRKELAAYKVPRVVQFIEAMPKSAVGKILRKDLRQLVG